VNGLERAAAARRPEIKRNDMKKPLPMPAR
jgi:hypothetical protein